jgi:ABC-2 type transport system ATP-binding protein
VLKKDIGNEVVTLTFSSPQTAEQAAAAVGRLAPAQQLSGRDLLCYFSAAAEKLPGLVRALDEAGIALEELKLTEPTLDDVFLRATGQRMAVQEEAR